MKDTHRSGHMSPIITYPCRRTHTDSHYFDPSPWNVVVWHARRRRSPIAPFMVSLGEHTHTHVATHMVCARAHARTCTHACTWHMCAHMGFKHAAYAHMHKRTQARTDIIHAHNTRSAQIQWFDLFIHACQRLSEHMQKRHGTNTMHRSFYPCMSATWRAYAAATQRVAGACLTM